MLSLQDGARFYPRYPGTIKVSWMKSLTPDSFSLMNINSLSRLKKRGGEGGREKGKERGRERDKERGGEKERREREREGKTSVIECRINYSLAAK